LFDRLKQAFELLSVPIFGLPGPAGAGMAVGAGGGGLSYPFQQMFRSMLLQ